MAVVTHIHVGDVGTALRVKVVDQDDNVVDVSTATTKQIILRGPDKVDRVFDASLYTDGTDGIIVYVTDDGDLNVPGRWRIQAFIAIGGGSWHTDDAVFKVKANI